MERDRLGRRRSESQQRGLRPLHPLLPTRWVSRALRVAMSESDWARFETVAQILGGSQSSQARVYGQALSRLLDTAAAAPAEPGPLDWLDWERRKASRLLHRGGGADGRASA